VKNCHFSFIETIKRGFAYLKRLEEEKKLGLALTKVGSTWFMVCFLTAILTNLGAHDFAVNTFLFGLIGLGLFFVGVFLDEPD
jgi:hypothetical protein